MGREVTIGSLSSVEMVTEKDREKELDKELGFKNIENGGYSYYIIYILYILYIITLAVLLGWCSV